MANSDHKGDGAPPRNVQAGPAKKKSFVPWIFLALGLLALLFGLRRCNDDTTTAVATVPATTTTTTTTTAETVVVPPATTAAGADTGSGTAIVGTSGIVGYLGTAEAVPRTFLFEKLNFETGKSAMRAADREEVAMLGATLQQYPTARIRIVGYADARGDASANATLGKERADSIKAALVAAGIAADRIETASGGETNPVDSNATATGQAENRRTELIVLQR
jgi:outer membrane protein OmpA-like peptidoglycan-associated protein